jgi:hypothetical protein
MKIARLLIFVAVIVAVSVFVGFLKRGLHQLFREGFWLGAAGCLICIGIAVFFMALKGRAISKVAPEGEGTSAPVRKVLQNGRPSEREIEEVVATFPGPITLNSSRLKWWFMVVLGVGMTAASIFVGVVCFLGVRAGQNGAGIGIGISVLGTTFFGLATVVSVKALRGGSLRLDEDGFEFSGFFRRQYRWSEVSDFGVFRNRGNASVVFKTATPNWNIWTKINSVFAGGRDARLPGSGSGVPGGEPERLGLCDSAQGSDGRFDPQKLFAKEETRGVAV